MRGYTTNRNRSSCNLKPNGVGGQGHPVLKKPDGKNQSSDPNVGF